ncbi:DUF2797 domain-containing protein [Coxiella endosymbiont of Amblyomma americanum]|uniref:DUF2797 domain-containing protein n=1 Tax=Coxiella endosymbiont of Amblyomma americanum TaxID=325775 RepID=UPI000AA5E024|nr:DUF2797 domain-containing protein [Coxiella endosymbiont of Amblyomma americanum]
MRKLTSILKIPIEYYFIHPKYGNILLNNWLGKSVTLHYTGLIYCIQCGRETNRSFQQGFCFPCLRRLKECNFCIIHPERCRIETGGCTVDDWAHAHCHSSHVVYLANSSGLKIGVTQKTQLPTRWIDQGAVQAIPVFQTNNRYQAGMIEVSLKTFITDRTNWRRMLRNDVKKVDLISERSSLLKETDYVLSKVIRQFKTSDIHKLKKTIVTWLDYPVLQYPNKIRMLSFEKTPVITGSLLGIKGQYFILDTGVVNIRKYCGYNVECTIL